MPPKYRSTTKSVAAAAAAAVAGDNTAHVLVITRATAIPPFDSMLQFFACTIQLTDTK